LSDARCGVLLPDEPYSNAGDKPWQMVMLGTTQRIQAAFSERAAAIC
jgi:hypothetical protein